MEQRFRDLFDQLDLLNIYRRLPGKLNLQIF